MTEKRWEILVFINQYISNHDYCPEYREIGEGCNISSTSVVNYYITPMIDAGILAGNFLPSGNMAPRTIHVTAMGRDLLASRKFEKKGG